MQPYPRNSRQIVPLPILKLPRGSSAASPGDLLASKPISSAKGAGTSRAEGGAAPCSPPQPAPVGLQSDKTVEKIYVVTG